MRNRLAAFYRTVRDRCEEFVAILACALDDGPVAPDGPFTAQLIIRGANGSVAGVLTRDTPLEQGEELRALAALFPRCTECGGDVEVNDWNAQLSPRRKNRVAHVACPFSLEVPDDGEW